jgi:hypothetical protein
MDYERCPSCNDLDPRDHEKTSTKPDDKARLSLDIPAAKLTALCSSCSLLKEVIHDLAPDAFNDLVNPSIMLDLTEGSPATVQVVGSGLDGEMQTITQFHLYSTDQGCSRVLRGEQPAN